MKDYAEVQSLGQILKDLEFQSTKNQIVTFVERYNPSYELIPKLRDIKEKEYLSVFQVAKASGIANNFIMGGFKNYVCSRCGASFDSENE